MNYRSYSHGVVLGLLLLIALIGLSTTATGSVAAQQVDLAASDLDGEGTIENPYVVTNASELQAMEDNDTANYILGEDIDASGTVNWNNGAGFDPIDDLGGTFDGAGHTIESLTINRPDEGNVGLFLEIGRSQGGQVYNVAISNADVTGDFNVGILAGGNSGESKITNVKINGTVNSNFGVGGIVGLNQGGIFNSTADVSAVGGNEAAGIASANQGLIENASVSGSIDGSNSVGGVVGSNRGMVRQARSNAEINGTDFVGGLIGYNYNSTMLSFASGSVTGVYTVGGLTGANSGNITRTYATGSVTADDRVGGLTGGSFQGGNVTNSFSTGAVTGQTSTGGSVGFAYNTIIKNVYWDEQTTGQATSAGNATGLTTAQMTGQAARTNMSGLNFSNVWETQPNDYPLLTSSISDEDSDSGILTVENLTVPDSISQGENISISATINNTDNNSLTQNITLSYSYTAGNVGGGASNSTSITVAGESTEQVSTQLTFPTDANSLTIEIASEDDSLSTTLSVNESSDTTYVDVESDDLAGSGTQTDPYVITNASELQAIEDAPSANYTLGNNIDASNTVHWNQGKGFDPINTFSGSLFGNSHIIRNVTIYRPNSTNVGIFGLNNGAVKKLTISGTVEGSYYSSRYAGAGAVAGNNYGIISNVTAHVRVNGSKSVGGLVGRTSNGGRIEYSIATGKVTGYKNAGGLVGELYEGGRVSRSYARGTVNGSINVGGLVGNSIYISDVTRSYATGNVTGLTNVGGLVGDNTDSSVKQSFAKGNVTGKSNVGGLVGYNGFESTVNQSYTRSHIIGENNVGGIVGNNTGPSQYLTAAQVNNSYFAGVLSAPSGASLTDAGGVIGDNSFNQTPTDAYWDATLDSIDTSAGEGTALSTAEMTGSAAEANMTGLDFNSIWKTQPDGYPVLRSQILDEDDDDDGGESGGGGSGQLVYEDTVFLSGSTVTVNASGVNAIAVENLPTNTTISEVSANGTYNPDERSIIYANLNEEEVLTNVTFNVNPNDSVYTTSDTITFSVDRTQVSLEVTTVPKELQGDVTSDQYAAVTNETNVLTAGSLSESINGWADNGKTNGVEIGALELSRLINYWSDT